MEVAIVTISDTTRGNQQVDNQRNNEVDGERVTEALDEDLTSELSKYVADVRCKYLDKQHVERGFVCSCDLY